MKCWRKPTNRDLLYIQEVQKYTKTWKNIIGGQTWKKNSCIYGQIWCMSTSKYGTSKASKAIATTLDTSMEGRRYHYELCDKIAERK